MLLCTHPITPCVTCIRLRLPAGDALGDTYAGRAYLLAFDVNMAFDVCDRESLSRVWESMGISGPFLEALRALYMEITMLVKVKSRLSPPIAFDTGYKARE